MRDTFATWGSFFCQNGIRDEPNPIINTTFIYAFYRFISRLSSQRDKTITRVGKSGINIKRILLI